MFAFLGRFVPLSGQWRDVDVVESFVYITRVLFLLKHDYVCGGRIEDLAEEADDVRQQGHHRQDDDANDCLYVGYYKVEFAINLGLDERRDEV